MDSNLPSDISRTLAGEDFEAVAARLPELQECIARAIAEAPDDAAREQILNDVLATHRRWLSLTRSLRAQIGDQLRSLAAQAHYVGQPDLPGHIVRSVG